MACERLAVILLLSPLLGTSQPQTPAPTGAIQGTVVDVDRLPMEGVRVSVIDVNRPIQGQARQASTDTKGHFFIGWLEWGQYAVYTEKEADGYEASFLRQTQAGVPVAEISQAAPTADVQVHIGPRAAVISGSITDAVTGRPVERPGLRMWHWTDGVDRNFEYPWGGVDARSYRFLIPPGKEVGLEFSAPGYETWFYCGDWGGSKPFPLNLPSGAKKTIDVKLRPLPK